MRASPAEAVIGAKGASHNELVSRRDQQPVALLATGEDQRLARWSDLVLLGLSSRGDGHLLLCGENQDNPALGLVGPAPFFFKKN